MKLGGIGAKLFRKNEMSFPKVSVGYRPAGLSVFCRLARTSDRYTTILVA